MSAPGDGGKSRASVSGGELEWQGELDSAMANIDSKLQHPRRRAADNGPQPTLPELGQVDITSELLDEIAWRVSQQMQRTQRLQSEIFPATAAAAAPLAPPPAPVERARHAMPHGTAIVIRIRRPLFSWRWFRRRRHTLTTLAVTRSLF